MPRGYFPLDKRALRFLGELQQPEMVRNRRPVFAYLYGHLFMSKPVDLY